MQALGRWVQMKIQAEILAKATAEAVAATAAAMKKGGELAVPVRDIDDEIPTLVWCCRMVAKHGRNAKTKVGKIKGLKEELLERVKRDGDKKGKLPKPKPRRGPR